MKNKGFTLIELLAVIVILAIIALIATPVILGIINDARKHAAEESAKLILSNVQLAYSTAYMNGSKDESGNKTSGTVPTLDDVRTKFNETMDKAVWTGMKIESSDKSVNCTVTTSDNKLVVSCTGGDYTSTTSATMELASTATN